VLLVVACGRAHVEEADAHYRRGIALLAAGQPGGREELAEGARLGPIDPALYLPLARACRDRGWTSRAAEFYRKYLARNPPDAEAVRAELRALDLDDLVVDEPARGPYLGVAAVSAALLAGAALLLRRRRAGPSLAQLVAETPELHPAIAYLVGCLRHELFKHRILAVGDALDGPSRAKVERAFLLARLYGGAPLPLAWAGHLGAFMRALGPRFDLARHDPTFREAGRAIDEIARLEVAFARDDADAMMRLARAHATLVAFDRGLAVLVAGLTHTRLDRALLDEVVAEVRAEYGPIAELTVGEVVDGVTVEMYRLDLRLILRNLLRNAALAAARSPSPRVALDVRVALEPTGEEIVRVRVRDTSPEPIALPLASRGHPNRGLGLVTTALDRYDGCLELEPGGDGFAKSVTVRLFRALDVAEAA
jgi:signal transduction histidine kinase